VNNHRTFLFAGGASITATLLLGWLLLGCCHYQQQQGTARKRL
jgi:hypothetical protein